MSRAAVLLALTSLAQLAGAAQPPSLVAQAEELLRRANRERDASGRYRLADEAQALAEQAVTQTPKDPQPLLTLAKALAVSDPINPESCRPKACERAVELLHKASTLDGAGLHGERIASELGIVLSRLRRFEEALTAYERALKTVPAERLINRWDDLGSRAVLYGNSAETLMALGRLDEAIARYRLAREASQPGELEWQLAQWGLGVAFDRDEQAQASREAIRKVLDVDPAMGRLSEEGVFFEPAGDKWYYLALGHEIAGDRDQAVAAWRSYLATGAPRYAKRARAHLDALGRAPSASIDLKRLRVAFDDPVVLTGARPVSDLRDTFREHEDDVRLCYGRALRERPLLKGELLLSLEVTPLGFVLPHARVFSSSVGSDALSRCVELAAASWRFRPVDVQHPESVTVRILLLPAR